MPVELICDVPNIGIQSLTEIQTRLEDYAAHPPPPPDPAASLPVSQTPVPESTPIEVLGLSVRPHNALMREGIVTIGRLAQMSSGQILGLQNVGEKSLAEIEEKLEAYLTEHPLPPPTPAAPIKLEPPTPLVDSALLARAIQVPLDNISVERLALPVRWCDQLRRQGFESVGELAQQTTDAFGQDSLIGEQLECYLTWLVEQDEATWADEVAGRDISPLHRLALADTTLDDLVELWLDTLQPQKTWTFTESTNRNREQRVIRWRYGLDGERLTLEEVGERLDVTRERVRQLQKRSLNILGMARSRAVIRPLKALLVYLLEQAGGLMNEVQVEAALRQELVIGDVEPVGVARLVFDLDDDFKWLRKAQVWGLTSSVS